MNEPLISLKNIIKRYQGVVALDDVSMILNQGEILGLFGHNGAGKTTMMKLILGIISPCQGQVKVLSNQPDRSDAWPIRAQIGYLPENVSFYEQLSGLEVLTYFSKLKGYDKSMAINLLEQVGISHAMNRKVKTYSKGMRQRLGLAQAFIGKPKLLLLDEPTVGLDPIATAEFYQTVEQLKTQGSSIILCSHVLRGVEQHIDRAMILSAGKVQAVGSLTTLRQQANLPVTIKPVGLQQQLNNHPELAQYVQCHRDNNSKNKVTNKNGEATLLVPEDKKIEVLKRLLANNDLHDLSLQSASLDQLYQHYSALANQSNQEHK
ncbi:ABC transporter ATP-binding protein [Thalassotalea sp. HSM 43]|uniref:ABC transporter ATP-binding protein n=1 Tax=Thalassotalea sp. HSM 43 TaxID=2552945 RepID=UPI0010810C1A|nr:ABC transporter ATP-binding protein [Thalassotalea sp. HSM 43]QBY03184.1 ABC transporter ATP-binding protein [Thalassotalea sp. HSM 43]